MEVHGFPLLSPALPSEESAKGNTGADPSLVAADQPCEVLTTTWTVEHSSPHTSDDLTRALETALRDLCDLPIRFPSQHQSSFEQSPLPCLTTWSYGSSRLCERFMAERAWSSSFGKPSHQPYIAGRCSKHQWQECGPGGSCC